MQISENESESDEDVAATPNRPRTTMLVVACLMAAAAVASFCCFLYQGYRFWSTAGLFLPTTVLWPSVVGHFLRSFGFAVLSWLLMRAAVISEASASDSRQCAFWRGSAWILSALTAFTVFELFYSARKHPFEIVFRPEFQSGFVELDPRRLEFRRGSEAPVVDWDLMRKHQSNTKLYVAPVTAISPRSSEVPWPFLG